MNRRDFFRGLGAAAVVAALPLPALARRDEWQTVVVPDGGTVAGRTFNGPTRFRMGSGCVIRQCAFNGPVHIAEAGAAWRFTDNVVNHDSARWPQQHSAVRLEYVVGPGAVMGNIIRYVGSNIARAG